MSTVPSLRLDTVPRLRALPRLPARPAWTRPPERPEDQTSTELMRRFQTTGDAETFDRLYEANADRISRVVSSCLRFGAGDLDASEIVQDVFVNVFRFARCFRADAASAFRRWSAEIARNAVRRAIRDRSRRRARMVGLVHLVEVAGRATPAEDVEQERSIRDVYPLFLSAYAHAYARLAPRDRAVLQAVEVEQRPYSKVGAKLGARTGAVKMIVFRARRRLLDEVARVLASPASPWTARACR